METYFAYFFVTFTIAGALFYVTYAARAYIKARRNTRRKARLWALEITRLVEIKITKARTPSDLYEALKTTNQLLDCTREPDLIANAKRLLTVINEAAEKFLERDRVAEYYVRRLTPPNATVGDPLPRRERMLAREIKQKTAAQLHQKR